MALNHCERIRDVFVMAVDREGLDGPLLANPLARLRFCLKKNPRLRNENPPGVRGNCETRKVVSAVSARWNPREERKKAKGGPRIPSSSRGSGLPESVADDTAGGVWWRKLGPRQSGDGGLMVSAIWPSPALTNEVKKMGRAKFGKTLVDEFLMGPFWPRPPSVSPTQVCKLDATVCNMDGGRRCQALGTTP